ETERVEGARFPTISGIYFHRPLRTGAKIIVSSLQQATESYAGEASATVFFVLSQIGTGPIYFFAGIISASMVMEISSPMIPGPYVMPKSWRMILELPLTPMR